MSASVLYMSMSLDGYIAGPNDEVGNPGGDGFMRLHDWYGFEAAQKSEMGEHSSRRWSDRCDCRRSAYRGAGRSLGR